jgi:hypothetical protein
MKWLREGFEHVVSLRSFVMISAKELEERVVGTKEITTEQMKAISEVNMDNKRI